MNAEYLLDAIGLLDDDLIQEAETYVHKKPRLSCQPWISLAACLAIVIVLGYGLTHLGMGGGNSAASGNSGGAASAPSLETSNGGDQYVLDTAPEEQGPPAPSPEDCAPGCAGFCPAIMVDGVLYWSTGAPVSGEVEESEIRTVTSYINTVPQMDGQTNFSQDLSARYAQTPEGLAVWTGQAWTLFDPVPPWER